jgi:TRAP-type mannitol/chloroaromatic compound transport system permease small subunit
VNLLRYSFRIIDGVNRWVGRVFSFLTVALVFVVVYDVFMRYVLNRPTEWGLELNGFLLLGITFLGGGCVSLTNSHVRVSIIQDRFPPRIRALVDVWTYLLFFFVCIALFKFGGQVALDSIHTHARTASMWGPPLWPSQILIPLGALLIGLQGLTKWIRDLYMVVKGNPLDGLGSKDGEQI